MSLPSELSDNQLRQELAQLGFVAGPVTPATKASLVKKLQLLRDRASGADTSDKKSPRRRTSPAKPVNAPSPQRSPAKSSPRAAPKSRSTSRNSRDKTLNFEEPVVVTPPQPPNPPKSTFKRTPTPTRPIYQKSRSANNIPKVDQSVFNPKPSIDYPTSNFSQSEDEDDQVGHYETSRLLSPSERRRFGESASGKKDTSPLDVLKKFGSSAVGFLQKSDQPRYVRHVSERGLYGTPGGRFSPVQSKLYKNDVSTAVSSDIPKLILLLFVSFTVVLITAYLCTAHSHTISRSKDVVLGTLSSAVTFVYNYAIVPSAFLLIALGVTTAAFYVYRQNKLAKEQFERETMSLVDQIADRVRSAGTEGVAEQHIRDQLFPPTRRTDKEWKLWNTAATFINEADSRIRAESKLINGVECNVWIWVTARVPETGWQGSAVVNGSPSKSSDSVGLGECLKIRGVAQSFPLNDNGELKRHVLEKLAPLEPIHYGEERQAIEPCVYMGFKDSVDSRKAFKKFHGQWFNGNLVQCKYMSSERYEARFPNWKDE